uniref:Uncharacterized protein n=1 Tax=Anopheles minimus TaxID=112268 RepID=A0A182WPR8_9DIPT
MANVCKQEQLLSAHYLIICSRRATIFM